MRHWVVALACAATVATLVAPASAHAERIRVVVLDFGGQGGARVRAMAVRGLARQHRVKLVAQGDAQSAASRLGVQLDDASGAAAVAAAIHARAFIVGEVHGHRRRWRATLRVRQGEDGSVVGHATFASRSLRGLAGVVRRTLWRRLGSALRRARAGRASHASHAASTSRANDSAAEANDSGAEGATGATSASASAGEGGGEAATPTGGESGGDGAGTTGADAADGSASEGPSGAPVRSALDVSLGASFFTRSLQYNDDLFGQLRAYAVPGAPALRLDLAWYPGAHVSSGFASMFGVTGHFEYAFALSSSDTTGIHYPTSFLAWSLGARVRIPLGRHEVGIDASYGQHDFHIGNAASSDPLAAATPGVPSVDYQYVEVGPDVTLAITKALLLRLHAGYRVLLSMGDIASTQWFPHATGGGVSLGAAVGFRVSHAFEARVAFDMRRYFFAFNPEVGDANVAGGAVDQYFSGTLSLVYHLDGAR